MITNRDIARAGLACISVGCALMAKKSYMQGKKKKRAKAAFDELIDNLETANAKLQLLKDELDFKIMISRWNIDGVEPE